MPIVKATSGNMRQEVLDYLRQKKAENPNYRVLDIGGGANPWADEFVTTYIDINEFETEKALMVGDICNERFWYGIEPYLYWDFAICTHVLEDVRNPEVALGWIQDISNEGFIAMPNKHTELSVVENKHWVGYAHHRWIYTVAGGVLKMLAKTAISNVFLYYPDQLDWLDKSQVSSLGGPLELGFRWQGDIPFEIMGKDLAAANGPEELAQLYIQGLAEGV